MRVWTIYFSVFAVLLVVGYDWECRGPISRLIRKLYSLGNRFLTGLRHALRNPRDWDSFFLFALAFCLGLTLAISWWGASNHPCHKTDWLFEGLKTVFSVLEGDSEHFRQYGSFCPWIANILSILVPLLTVGTVLVLLWNRLPHHIPWFGKVWYIFSELEPHSIHLAKSICDPKGVFIFLRSRRGKQNREMLSELKELRYHLYPKTETELLRWPWRRKKKLRFFFLSDNTDINFTRTNYFLEAADRKKLFYRSSRPLADGEFRQELYLLSETESAPMLIDHLREKIKSCAHPEVFVSTELRLLDRYRAISYALLHEAPVHSVCHDRCANVLVLGFGRIGREFFRAASSLGIIPGCETTFTICDVNIAGLWDSVTQQCPEWKNSKNVTTIPLNAESDQLLDLIQKEQFTYILVALGDDERNIKIATLLKRYYRRRYWEKGNAFQPQICVNIEDQIKSDYTKTLWTAAQKWERSIRVFGTISEAFSAIVLMPKGLWLAAQWIHQFLNKKDPRELTHWSEYERRSSIACAAHAEYHTAPFPGDYQAALRSLDEKDMNNMILTEHRRWMAYVRGEGMQKASIEMVKAYYQANHHHVDVLARLTPCLVDSRAELDKVYDAIQEIPNNSLSENTRKFWDRDREIILHADVIQRIIKTGQFPAETK